MSLLKWRLKCAQFDSFSNSVGNYCKWAALAALSYASWQHFFTFQREQLKSARNVLNIIAMSLHYGHNNLHIPRQTQPTQARTMPECERERERHAPKAKAKCAQSSSLSLCSGIPQNVCVRAREGSEVGGGGGVPKCDFNCTTISEPGPVLHRPRSVFYGHRHT